MFAILIFANTCKRGSSRSSPLTPKTRLLMLSQKLWHKMTSNVVAANVRCVTSLSHQSEGVLCNWKYFGTYLGILHISRDLVMRIVNKCFGLVMHKVKRYFGTYLGHLPTIPASPQCDTFQLIPVSF